jgi:hypothetical protein
MRKKVIDIVLIASMTLGFINSSHAQKQGEKTLLQQLEDAEENEKRRNLHQGQAQPAERSLQRARENAKSDPSACPQGSTRRKIEDVKEFLVRHEELQKKFAMSLERFTTKAIEKNPAIDEFNQLIKESNELVVWGRGKVTDGACGSPAQTAVIGKAIGATKILIEDYRRVLQ